MALVLVAALAFCLGAVVMGFIMLLAFHKLLKDKGVLDRVLED